MLNPPTSRIETVPVPLPREVGPRPAYPALALAVLTAWTWAVLLLGRSLPWQANLPWVAVFLLAFAAAGVWWWRFFRRIGARAPSAGTWLVAAALGAAPFLVVALPALALVYGSDGVNHLLELPFWRMPFVVGLALLLIATDALQRAGAGWLRGTETGIIAAVGNAFAKGAGPIALVCLVAVALLQASAGAMPVGDDMGRYVKVADFLRAGLLHPDDGPAAGGAYPQDVIEGESTGMSKLYPALPTLPALLAMAFSLLGRNTAAIGLVLALSTALFSIALYAALKGLTLSRPASYAGTLAIFLFPPYRIHVLGVPEPDALFVVLLLAVAAFAAKASRGGRWPSWVALGVGMGLATLARHEGLYYSAALYATFFLFRRERRGYWLSLACWAATLIPFVLVYYRSTGSLWPSTFSGTLKLEHVETNLNLLSWASLPWYAQAVGVEKEVLIGLFAALGLGALSAATLLLRRRNGTLLFIPLAGLGDVAMALMVDPLVLQTASPVELQRHVSSGLAYLALAAAYAAYCGWRWITGRCAAGLPALPLAALVLLMGADLYYETERLARPEYYFQGHASLLWTGSSYLLPDLLGHPVPLPAAGDSRPWEQQRQDMMAPLAEMDQRKVNRSEPFQWASLLLALFGLVHALARNRTASALGDQHPALVT